MAKATGQERGAEITREREGERGRLGSVDCPPQGTDWTACGGFALENGTSRARGDSLLVIRALVHDGVLQQHDATSPTQPLAAVLERGDEVTRPTIIIIHFALRPPLCAARSSLTARQIIQERHDADRMRKRQSQSTEEEKKLDRLFPLALGPSFDGRNKGRRRDHVVCFFVLRQRHFAWQ